MASLPIPSLRPAPDSRDGNRQHSQPKRRLRAALAALIVALLPVPAMAQHEPTLHDRAIAAGYKAAMLCSGIFDAEAAGTTRSEASIEANELKGIYPEYDALIAALPATIDRQGHRVLVRYDSAMPSRIAASSGGGCTNLPIGTREDTLASEIIVSTSIRKPSGWPLDDTAGPVRTLAPFAPAVDRAFAQAYGAGSNTTAVVILQDGKIVAERYAPGFNLLTPQRTWSVAKSISGSIIGAAVRKGLIDPKAPAPIPEWQQFGDPRAAITLDNLMRMASGLHSDTAGNRTDAVYFGGTAVTEETVAWPLEAAPGTRFRYANNDILLAIRALRSKMPPDASGVEPRFPDDLLLAQIDMNRTFAEHDWRGNYILSSQVWSTARDLARLGQFWLQDGVWQGERILPEGWMEYMTTPSGPQPASGPGYGATMWLFGPAQGLPEGSYAAQGNRGQFIMVIPSRRLVIVRRGEDPGAARFDIAKFAADVMEASQ
jgi:CubicO group peptidase (beta-lactamase class C family)